MNRRSFVKATGAGIALAAVGASGKENTMSQDSPATRGSTSRRERLLAALQEHGAEAFIAHQRPNQLYLLDHVDASTVISRGNCHAIVFTASETVVFPGVWISNACRDLLPGCEVVPNELGDPPPEEQLAARLRQMGLRKVISDRLQPEAGSTEVVVDDIAAGLRRCKDERDLAGMREAARVADLGMRTAFAAIRPGVTCSEAVAAGTAAMLRAGAEDASMAPASGVGTYYLDSGEDPRRVIREGDMVFIDMIVHVHGYLGDMTRAGIVGKGTPQQRDLLDTVQRAYHLGVKSMVPGASAAAVYQSVVDLFTAKGWAKYYVHHLGHGLGLGGDRPWVGRGSKDVLQAGDAVSCEPGLYIPGLGGARVESMVYVSEKGPEVLTQCPLEPEMG